MNTVTDTQVISRLVESDAGKKIAADIMREQTAARMDTRAQIERLRKERGELARAHADDVAATTQIMTAARKALTEAENEHRQAVMTQKQQRAHYDARINKLQRQLTTNAPADIDSFLDWLAGREHETQQTEISERSQKTDRINTYSDNVIREYWTNAASLDDRLKAIRAARAEAISLKGRILESDDLDTRLEALRESLPAIEMRFSHEK